MKAELSEKLFAAKCSEPVSSPGCPVYDFYANAMIFHVPGAVTAQPCVLFFEIALSVECFVYPTDLRIRVDN